jgi:two-component system, cell cycle response regulator
MGPRDEVRQRSCAGRLIVARFPVQPAALRWRCVSLFEMHRRSSRLTGGGPSAAFQPPSRNSAPVATARGERVGGMETVESEQRLTSESGNLGRLLDEVGQGGRALVGEATRALVRRFGDRGSCVLVDDRARVVLSTEVPSLRELPIDLARYPEITTALASHEIVVIGDVRRSSTLEPVATLLPSHLGAVVVIPLVAGPRCLGVIIVRSERPREALQTDVVAARFEGRLLATLLELQFGRDLSNELKREAGAPVGVVPLGTRRPPPPTGKRQRILVAEDDADQAATIGDILIGEGFDVLLTRNGEDLLKQAHRAPPDLILLDGHMPILNGFHAAENLLADPRTSGVPILFLSAAEDLLFRLRGLKPDTIDFLRKPYAPAELLARVERALKQGLAYEELRAEAEVDALTGLSNARALVRTLTIEQSRISRYGATSAVVMMDVDKLKTINDRHGHVVGSRILQAIGELLRGMIRETDLAARYGGDEFVAILAHTSVAEGGAFAERFLSRVRRLWPEGIDVSMSIGIASLGGPNDQSSDVLLANADAAAYRAKRLGGNRACVFDGQLDSVMSRGQQNAEGAT